MLKYNLEINGINYGVVDIKNSSVWDYVEKIRAEDGEILGYKVVDDIAYFSERYSKWVGVEKGDRSDGATYAKDINAFGWLFHDELKVCGTFEDGTKCSNWQASVILGDLLALQGRWFRRYSWLSTTYVFGEVKSLFSRLF